MAQFTHNEIKDICPHQTDIALIKLNSLISSLTEFNIHLDVGIHNIALQHKMESGNLSVAFQGLRELVIEKLNQKTYSCSDTHAFIDRIMRAFITRMMEHRQIRCMMVRPCLNKEHPVWEDSQAVIEVAVVLLGQPKQVLLTKLNLMDIAFEMNSSSGVCLHPFPVWEDELKQHPEALKNMRLLRDIERNVG